MLAIIIAQHRTVHVGLEKLLKIGAGHSARRQILLCVLQLFGIHIANCRYLRSRILSLLQIVHSSAQSKYTQLNH